MKASKYIANSLPRRSAGVRGYGCVSFRKGLAHPRDKSVAKAP